MESEEQKVSPSESSSEKNRTSAFPNSELIKSYVQTQDFDLKNLFPSQVETGIKLEERQETTRSQLATFLIKILAGTLIASFLLIIILIIMSGFIDEKKITSFEKTSALVKDLITFILTAQTGLIGTALGFYFGSRGSNSD
ncbi:hypothetical protein VB691_05470 [Crocosphaera sp. XPORK-15E]|nr:hypothetical protein [Crocosphaera sp. XPORK-15E]